MRDNYSNLRRRTRDSGWQWLLMGTLLGLGLALVVCVGAYALGAVTFPALEEASTPIVQVAPNETEVALQALSVQQTMEADQLAAASPTLTDASGTEPLAQPQTPLAVSPSATPSPLPGSEEPPLAVVATETPQAAQQQPQAQVEDIVQTPATTEPSQSEAVAMAVDTPVVGTPPSQPDLPELGLPQPAAIPPALEAIQSELSTITGGTFTMGTTPDEAKTAADECALYGKSCDSYLDWVKDSFPTHQVTVDDFQMETTEVSAAQFVAFLNWLGPGSHKDQCQGQPCAVTSLEEPNSYIISQDDGTYAVRNSDFYSNHPATFVTWWGAAEYCDTLNRRLPTEAEWERAARGAQNYIYPWGFEFDATRAMTSVAEDPGTVPVTAYALEGGASPYGVLNMAGNVAEWVEDWYGSDYYTQLANSAAPPTNPNGPIAGTERVLRGGSWDTIPFFVRSVHRMSAPPDQPRASIGFRCAADLAQTAPPSAPVSGGDTGQTTTSGAAPTLAPAPTRIAPPTNTPAGPTPTLAPG